MLLIPGLAITGGVVWFALNARYVTTNNAYIKSEIVAVSTDIDGRIISVNIEDNDYVEKGQLLFTLDPRPYQIKLEKAQAKLASIRLKLDGMRAQYSQFIAQESEAQNRVAYQKSEFERQDDLSAKGLGIKRELDQARHQWERSEQDLLVVKEKSRQALAALGGKADIPAEIHPMYLEALTEENEARLMLDYTQITALASGIVSKMTLEPGEWVEQGESVFYLVGTGRMWVEANLKETQLTRVKIGQKVETRIDAFPDTPVAGRITRISAATGSEFMVLPAQNATGNWIKVVQRVPVKIEFDPVDFLPELRAGMTVEVSIDTVHEDGLITNIRNLVAMLSNKTDGVTDNLGTNNLGTDKIE
jgi:membrane fusion protein (multidrug efflux system)